MADSALYAAKDAGRGTFRIYKRGAERRQRDASSAA
jgi:predicted signal transduction protein with EAL and GGDEF domain